MVAHDYNGAVIDWLLSGDVSVQYQAHRDLLGDERPDLQARVATEGWGVRYLTARNPDGTWGRGFYQPKWISSHYSLLDLRTLELPRDNSRAQESVEKILRENRSDDGGINPAWTVQKSDVCVNGMFLTYACYFCAPARRLQSIVDFILKERMADGGFNCNRGQPGARHSSVHSTLSVLEGIEEYRSRGYTYRLNDLLECAQSGREFLLQHRLYKSDHTGEIINREFLTFAFPPRWKYNVLRALDYFRNASVPYDKRMSDALDVVRAKRRKDGRWPAQRAHPGAVHFTMEEARSPGRWNTLLALRVLRAYTS